VISDVVKLKTGSHSCLKLSNFVIILDLSRRNMAMSGIAFLARRTFT